MAEDSDGIEEAFEGQVRVLLTAAGQVGERIARAREDALRRAQAQSEQQARELRSRFEAEHRAARTELGNVYRADWWDRATPEQIGRTYQVARAWAHEDPEAVRAEQRMRDEVRTRYGVDVDATNADPAAVRAAVERAEQDRAQGAGGEREKAAAETAEAAQLMAQADRDERAAEQARAAAEHEPDPAERSEAREVVEQHQAAAETARAGAEPLYDSAERREATAREMEARGVAPEQVATVMRADVSQAKPATEAAKSPRTRAPKARRTSRGRGAQVHRSGLDR